MEWIEQVPRRHAHIPAAAETAAERAGRIDRSLTASAQALESLQQSAGCWWGDLTADTTLESDYILYALWRHQPDADGEWQPPATPRIRKACQAILRRQLPDGGWSIYPGGPMEISASVKGYLALKMAGDAMDAPHMVKSREAILTAGGVTR